MHQDDTPQPTVGPPLNERPTRAAPLYHEVSHGIQVLSGSRLQKVLLLCRVRHLPRDSCPAAALTGGVVFPSNALLG